MKKHIHNYLIIIVLGCVILLQTGNTLAGEQEHHNVAILTFEAPDKEISDLGRKITDLMTAYLSAEPGLRLVERNKIDDILKELGLSLTGIVDESEMVKIGKLAGAQIMVTGRAFVVDEELIITARIIGVETSRVYAEIVKGPLSGKLSSMAEDLSQKVASSISANASTMAAGAGIPFEETLAKLKSELEGRQLPKISVIVEETYSGSPAPDPASATEMLYILKECGFEVYEEEATSLADWATGFLDNNKIGMPKHTRADVLILGEAIGEFATRRGELVSSKGRVEFRAITPKDGKILAIDRKTKTAVDLSVQIACKKALQEVTAEIAPDFIRRLVEEWEN